MNVKKKKNLKSVNVENIKKFAKTTVLFSTSLSYKMPKLLTGRKVFCFHSFF